MFFKNSQINNNIKKKLICNRSKKVKKKIKITYGILHQSSNNLQLRICISPARTLIPYCIRTCNLYQLCICRSQLTLQYTLNLTFRNIVLLDSRIDKQLMYQDTRSQSLLSGKSIQLLNCNYKQYCMRFHRIYIKLKLKLKLNSIF